MPIDPGLAKRVAIVASAIGLLLIIACGVIFWFPTPTVVVLVRHAERSDALNCDPATVKNSPNRALILVNGQSVRAQALAHVGGEDSITAIYASEFCRTVQTVEPLATQLGLQVNAVEQYAANGTPNVDNLVTQVKTHKGQVVLVAGHTDTVPLIIEKLANHTIAPIGEDEFDNFYVVVIPRFFGRAKVVRLKYGQPT